MSGKDTLCDAMLGGASDFMNDINTQLVTIRQAKGENKVTWGNLWPNFGKSTILANLTHKIFSSQKQPLNLKFYAMVGWIHSRYIKL